MTIVVYIVQIKTSNEINIYFQISNMSNNKQVVENAFD